jgi:hypothetical protein
MKKIRIGCIITPYFNEEISKKELIAMDEKERPWLKNVPKNFVISHKNKSWVSYDISILLYLKSNYGAEYDFVPIIGNDKKIYEKAQSCNMVFLLIFDKLEAYHVLSKQEYQRIENVFSKDNIFPPAAFQMLINYKNDYYQYLQKKNVSVLPMVVIKSEDIEEGEDKEEVMLKISELPKGDEGKIIGKPIFGQESIDFEVFEKNGMYKVNKYLERIQSLYEGCIFQPYIKALEKNGEWRVFFIGNRFVYMIRTQNINTFIDSSKDKDFDDALRFAHEVFKALPTLNVLGKPVDRLLTRIDIGCCQGDKGKQKKGFFVSEVEFVPSMYFDVPEVQKLQIDKKLSEQILKIVRQVDFSKQSVLFQSQRNQDDRTRIILVLVLVIILVIIMIFRWWSWWASTSS